MRAPAAISVTAIAYTQARLVQTEVELEVELHWKKESFLDRPGYPGCW
jgi:hypothetical protein